MKKRKKIIIVTMFGGLVIYSLLYWLQTVWAHESGKFEIPYQEIELSENSNYETIFLQTGLGKNIAEELLKESEFSKVLEVQEEFWETYDTVCKPVFGLFARVDKIVSKDPPQIVDLQQGDILVTLSTHSAGWHHGHAGLVLDDKHVLECVKWGEVSEVVNVKHWRTYSNFVVLRVKAVSNDIKEQVVSYAKKNLCGVPYRLSVGLLGDKSPAVDSPSFGTHCGHSIWYAWNQFGYDLDSDGGRLVTPNDILHSDKVEIIQVHGMNPQDFLS